MKTILTLLILFSAIALPALGELTVQDLDKIRSIIKESEQELKAMIKESEQELKAMIKESEQELKAEIAASEKRTKEYVSQEIRTVNVKIAETDKRLSQIFWWVIALMGLIALAIAAPQALIAWQNRKDRSLERQVETLTQEIETLKQQHAFRP